MSKLQNKWQQNIAGNQNRASKRVLHVIEIPVYQGRVKKQEQNQMTNIIVH